MSLYAISHGSIPYHISSDLYSHGLKDDTTLDSIIRIQHVVEENVTYRHLSPQDKLPKQIRPLFDTLVSKNTIVIDEDCHDRIIENIIAREHLDYEDFFSSSDDENSSEASSSDEESI